MKKMWLFMGISLLSGGVLAKTWEVEIQGMSCEACVKSITGELKKFQAVKLVSISLEKKKGTITADDKATDFGAEQIKSAVEKAGYKTGAIVSTK